MNRPFRRTMSGVAPTADEMAQAARTAVASGDWITARTLFETLVEREPTPEALAGLGDTLWWLGRTDDAIKYQERAYAAFRRDGDAAHSALTAVGLYLLYRISLGNAAAARGWLARAARLVEEAGLGRVRPAWATLTWNCARSANSGRPCSSKVGWRKEPDCSTKPWPPLLPASADARTPSSTPAAT